MKNKKLFYKETEIEILAKGEEFYLSITRQEFEDLCKDDFYRTITIVEKALKDTNLTKERIDDIILVWGSTRIPKIQQIVK